MAIRRNKRFRHARFSQMRRSAQHFSKKIQFYSQDISGKTRSLTQTSGTQQSNAYAYADRKAKKNRKPTEQKQKQKQKNGQYNEPCVSPSHTFSGGVAPLMHHENTCCCCCSTSQPALLNAEQTSTDYAAELARVPRDAAATIGDAHGSKADHCVSLNSFSANPTRLHYCSAAIDTGRHCWSTSFSSAKDAKTMYLPKTKEKEKEKEVTTPAMHYPADVPAYIASIDSGLGRRNIDSIVSTESSGYSWIPAHIPLLDLGMHSPAVSAGISQRVLSRAADGQKRQYGRSSRWIQSIAATGTSMATMSKSRRHGLYLSSQQGFTDDSSIDGSDRHKISIVDLVASHSDPMIVAKKAEKLDDALSIRTGSLNVGCIESTTGSLQHVKTASDALSAERQDTHESSVLWMHSTFSEKEHREQHQQQGARTQSDPAFISNGTSSNMQGVGGASNAFVDTSKFMFYSSQTGAVLSSSLVKPVFGDLGIDSLIDIILGHEAELAEGNSPCFWLDIAGASAQEIEDLCDIFELHPLSTQDIVNGCPRDKIDVFGNYTFIAYSTIAYGTGSGRPQSSRYGESSSNILQWSEQPNNLMAKHLGCDCKSSAKRGQIFIAMRSNYVVTFHCGHQRSVVHQVLERLDAMKRAALIVNNDDDDDDDDGRSHKNSSIASMPPYTKEEPLSGLVDFPAYIVYAILDEITDQLSPEILAIEQNVDAIDELVLVLSHNEHENMLQRMGEQRRRILTTWQVVQPKAEIVETLAQMLRTRLWTGSENLAEEVAQYLGDVHGHLAAAIGSCTRAEAVLSRSHANYLAKISLELSRATFDSNSTTERWTMLGTIVVPINIVTSFLGVNLKVPGQDRDDTLNFFIVMACMVVYAAATLAFWRWRRII